jgi:hypothetical protein
MPTWTPAQVDNSLADGAASAGTISDKAAAAGTLASVSFPHSRLEYSGITPPLNPAVILVSQFLTVDTPLAGRPEHSNIFLNRKRTWAIRIRGN